MQAKNIISLSFSPSQGRLKHGQSMSNFILFHSSRHKYIYVYIYIYIYIYTYISTCYIFFFLFDVLAENLKKNGVFGWLCFILVKSCFNSQDMHLRLQLFHVLFYQIMVNQATNSSNLVYKYFSTFPSIFIVLWPAMICMWGPHCWLLIACSNTSSNWTKFGQHQLAPILTFLITCLA